LVLGQSIEITRTTYKLENMPNGILAWLLAFIITATDSQKIITEGLDIDIPRVVHQE
jgi:hypothetical protein